MLSAERAALVAGDLDALVGLLDEKNALFQSLEANMIASDGEREAFASLQVAAQRNQKLLVEAMQGIKTVMNRIADLRRVRDSLDTYDQKGNRTQVKSAQHSIERRA